VVLEKDGEDQLDQLCEESRRRGITYKQLQKRHVEWISHILQTNCHLQQVTERKIEGRIDVMGG
jgi:hypothetical protein